MAALTPQHGAARFLRHVSLERGLSAHTVDAYARDLRAYESWLTERGVGDLEEVTPEMLSEYVAVLGGWNPEAQRAPMAPESIARRLSTVRSMHRFLYAEGLLTTYAGSGVRTPKKAQRLPKALSHEQVEALLDAPPEDTPVGLRDRALLELLYATGARVSEITQLDVDDVFSTSEAQDAWLNPHQSLAQGGFLRITGKGSKQRVVPYGSYAGRALAAYLVRARPAMVEKGPGTPALFVGPRGGRVSRQGAWLIIRAAAERAHIPTEVSPHTLRHSFATHLLAGGADVRAVQELLGHASVETTQIYTQVTIETLRDHYLTAHPRAV